MKKGGLKPRKPRKTPGLSKGAFLKKPINGPDLIGTDIWDKTAKGVHSNRFKIWVSFRFKSSMGRYVADRKQGATKAQ
jgi:hypothetical protein